MAILAEWRDFFMHEKAQPYWKTLQQNLNQAALNHEIYPKKSDIFSLFQLVAPNDIKVVIIGQDPYHGPKQANGIAFSVSNEVPAPPSLQNIFKELESDLKINHFHNNDLSQWVKQGVFLINTTLTVSAGEPNSHRDFGWNVFVINCLNYLNDRKKGIIYCLFGKYALNTYNKLNDKISNQVVAVGHPSPFSYDKYFKGTKPFSKINSLLQSSGLPIIDWTK